jgi:alpha-2-macroglobulin
LGDNQFTVSSNLWSEARQFTQQNLYGPEQSTTTLLSEVPGQKLHIDKQGPGQLYYTSLLTYPLTLRPGGSVPQVPMPLGLTIQRSFYRIQAEPVGPLGTMRLKTQLITNGKVHAGETVLMRVVVNTPVALPYAMLDVSLPSGGEVISNDPRENLLDQDTQSSDFQFDWGNWWWSHQDILDDRVVMFASSIPAGKSEFHALVRTELPGRFQMNPVKLNGMYTKRIQAYSNLDQVEVIE